MGNSKEDALNYHRALGRDRAGKIGTEIFTSCETKEDLSLAYTPGVAVPCLEISEDPEKIYEYTNKGNSVAVVSNGSAVLGLGNIGAAAGKPVMEGKALLFKHFADVDATDVLVNSQNPDDIINVVKLISPTYGGINLEDIKAPECFYVEEELKKILGIPVFHDDQHGTAIVVGAGLLNALKVNGKSIENIKVVFSGAGAAGIACAKMLVSLGVPKKNIIICDSKGVIYLGREVDSSKKEFAVETEFRKLEEVIKGADIFIGVSKRDVLTPEMLLSMNENPVVFAMANPNPEIDYNLAKATRDDVIIATGRSDFPNQVNNVLGFPGIFRGALDVRAKSINEDMKVAAVWALANIVEDVSRDYIIPSPFEKRVVVEIAFAVAGAAIKSGVADVNFNLVEYRKKLEEKFLDKKNVEEVRASERYKHFKGGEYEVVEVAKDCEDSEKRVVVYKALYDNGVWVRSLEEFTGFKEIDGKRIKRFEKIGKSMVKVKIKKLKEGAVVPSYAHEGDAGMDVVAISKRVTDKFVEYGTGLSFEVPENYVMLIFPRSSVSSKDLVLANSVGVLDSGYRGELSIRFKILGNDDYEIGERVAQVMVLPYPKIEFEEVGKLSETVRGEKGFGSTDNNI